MLREEEKDLSKQMRLSTIDGWMRGLHTHLLHKRTWTDNELTAFSTLVADIQKRWETITDTKPFPKLHMLTHAVEFASNHRCLGRLSEAQIESHHVVLNTLANRTHANMCHDVSEQLRRSLADIALRHI